LTPPAKRLQLGQATRATLQHRLSCCACNAICRKIKLYSIRV